MSNQSLNYQLISEDLQKRTTKVIDKIKELDTVLKDFKTAVQDLDLEKQNTVNFINVRAQINDKMVALVQGLIKTKAQIDVIDAEAVAKFDMNREELKKWMLDTQAIQKQLVVDEG